jgi:peptidoglycan/xylan/chitin deacetylase (PgdA/CDA1 family)
MNKIYRMKERLVHILNFHGLGEPPANLSAGELDCWIDKSFFERILDLAATFPHVKMTFDDSNVSDYDIALPALSARKLTAKFFAVAGRIGQPGYVSAEQLRALAAAGMDIGSHGMRHRRWTGLDPENLNEELVQARSRLEETVGAPVKEAACPFGSYDRQVLAALRKSGYEKIYTSDEGPAQPEAWLLARNTVRRTDDLAKIRHSINSAPAGMGKIWRALKLQLKQLR